MKKLYFNKLIRKIEARVTSQIKFMPPEAKELLHNNFNIPLFNSEQYKTLKESVTLPEKIEPVGNPLPFNNNQ